MRTISDNQKSNSARKPRSSRSSKHSSKVGKPNTLKSSSNERTTAIS